MKILITGGAGFIASHIAESYLSLGHQVVIIDNLSSGFKKNIPAKAVFHHIDISSPDLHTVIADEKPDIVNHHAAQINVRVSADHPILDAQINIIGGLNVLEACRKQQVKKIIFASTGGAIYDESSPRPTVESARTEPKSPYGIAKLCIEKYLHFYAATHNIPSVILRYANVYGPRQNAHGEAGVVAIFSQKLLKKEVPIIYGNGLQTRDYVFVEDVVACNQEALTASPGIYNVGTGIETSVLDLSKTLVEACQSPLQPQHAPARPEEQLKSCLAPGKLQKTITPLKVGLLKTVDWFKKELAS